MKCYVYNSSTKIPPKSIPGNIENNGTMALSSIWCVCVGGGCSLYRHHYCHHGKAVFGRAGCIDTTTATIASSSVSVCVGGGLCIDTTAHQNFGNSSIHLHISHLPVFRTIPLCLNISEPLSSHVSISQSCTVLFTGLKDGSRTFERLQGF